MNTVGSATSYGHIENLVRKRDCILVAMNYRLGIFGYLALKDGVGLLDLGIGLLDRLPCQAPLVAPFRFALPPMVVS